MSALWHCVGLGVADDVVCFEKQETWGKWSKGAGGKLKDYIKFNTAVRYVKYENETKTSIVTVEDVAKKETKEETFTHVIVASGIYSFPNTSTFPGIESFGGRVIHSHDLRSARHFHGQRVLVIGAAYSGEDISTQLIKFGAQSVTLAFRRQPKSASCNIPNSIVEKPMVEPFKNNTAHFVDRSSVEIDAVIFATGYCPAGLYNGTLFHKEGNNNLFYIGVLEQFHTFTYCEALAYWTCRFIRGDFKQEPVSREEMQKSADEWHQLANECKNEHDIVRFQARVIKNLVEAADYPYPEICRMELLLLEWIDVRQGHLDLTTFRDHSYKSVYTGKMTPPSNIPFMDNMDDSVEAYLGQK
ncbi:GSXL9-like protein [Mya arenaria]|uniref:Flavin-containing monooxygenase n=1 Tax=Mya arenaria TaxID=6604 RepID=A0ABY7EH84_MYAAR|nr:GSXL9-like protein [Mya arenaria]